MKTYQKRLYLPLILHIAGDIVTAQHDQQQKPRKSFHCHHDNYRNKQKIGDDLLPAASLSQSVQKIQIVVDGITVRASCLQEIKLQLFPDFLLFCQIPDFLFHFFKITALFSGRAQHIIKVFLSRRGRGIVHFPEYLVHIQVIPGNVV